MIADWWTLAYDLASLRTLDLSCDSLRMVSLCNDGGRRGGASSQRGSVILFESASVGWRVGFETKQTSVSVQYSYVVYNIHMW